MRRFSVFILVTNEAAAVLATLVRPNHIVTYAPRDLLPCRLAATSLNLGIFSQLHLLKRADLFTMPVKEGKKKLGLPISSIGLIDKINLPLCFAVAAKGSVQALKNDLGIDSWV